MTERAVIVPPDAIRNQRLAAEPTSSAWVSANAGSGKTFILTRRVLRLLLAGAAPETILCLTYTKAAAAEMRHRLSHILAEWTRAGDEALDKALTDILDQRPDAALRNNARSLFARALETPGGLKISTIHAFCEAVLQRFPYEAGVPVNFSVIEDQPRAELITRARESVLAGGLRGKPETQQAVAHLFEMMSDSQIETAIASALTAGRKLDGVLSNRQQAISALQAFLGLQAGQTKAAIEAEIINGMIVPFDRFADIFAIEQPKPEGNRFEDKLSRIDRFNPDPAELVGAYLNKDGSVPQRSFPRKAIRETAPALADQILTEAERLAELSQKLKAATLFSRTEALLAVLDAIVFEYEEHKRARSLLDFDDLIMRTAALFADTEASAWVRYKLDAGIDHVLVDESQDTNPEQWDVIDQLVQDYFAGEGAAQRPKTLFAVGDPKQSIYSFQGAEPRLFGEKGRNYALAANRAEKQWNDVRLRTSFRTLPGILSGVDCVCANPIISGALFAPEGDIAHESARHETGGLIEIWPMEAEPEVSRAEQGWPLEPVENLANASRRVARKIAQTIRFWIDNNIALGTRGRPIRTDDILILVQARKSVFIETVRALKEAGIASPGADRLPVSTHIAVDDLLGLADILLNPDDDLMLAAILRSPLCEVSEDDLYELAANRPDGQSLWTALGRSSIETCIRAYGFLTELRSRLDFDRPYDFFASVLYRHGGLRAFHTRLGPEVDDVLGEFLDLALAHEQSDQPSLTGFIAAMRKSDITIKRELAERTGGVRIMTVHGAKGLEAPIVFLADATQGPGSVKDRTFFDRHEGKPFMLYCGRSEDHTEKSASLKDAVNARNNAEYWRNLYVGMTRAEDVLIVAGPKPPRGEIGNSWYGAVKNALAPCGEEIAIEGSEDILIRYPKGATPLQERLAVSETLVSVEQVETYQASVPPPAAPVILLSPSRHDGAVRPDSFATSGENALDPALARQRGTVLHALLQHLASVPEAKREAVAHSAAFTLLGDETDLVGPLAREALAILNDSDLASIFGPNSRAEVSFSLAGTQNGMPARLSGRFDRLVVDHKKVLIVDYKSDASPPADRHAIPPAYIGQLALYRLAAQRLFPDRDIEAGILWTANRKLMLVDASELNIGHDHFVPA